MRLFTQMVVDPETSFLQLDVLTDIILVSGTVILTSSRIDADSLL